MRTSDDPTRANAVRRYTCIIVCLEEGRYQVLVWVKWYASDIIEYDRRKSELSV